MFDSMKMTTPTRNESTRAPRGDDAHPRRSRPSTNPRTPPPASTVAISAPMTSVNSSTFVLPASANTATAPSMAPPRPASGFHPARIVNPSQTPAPSDRYTWRVPIASPMARTGGSREVQDGSISGGIGGA